MSNVILTAAQKFGPTLVRTAGRIGLQYAQNAITNAFDNRVFEGPRLESFHIQSSRDGAPMARVYGRARIAGQVIWAARLREIVTETRQGSKGGGPVSRDCKYTLSFAIGLCEGEVLGVGQIWANGQPLQITGLNTRIYLGTETQSPDPLIEEIEGANAPAFRGTAYMVFEDMPVDDFGARLPQLNFEIIRLPKRTDDTPRLEDIVAGVDLIPGSGEFAYGTTIAEERLGPGISRALNMNNLSGQSDIDLALDQLQTQLPNCKSVTLVVSWFGDDLRAGHCKLRAGVEGIDRTLNPRNWTVNGDSRSTAYVVSEIDGRPAFGGTPDDTSVVEAIRALKSRGYKISLYPFILMDIPDGNTLPNPYGGTSQPVFPWRGRITCDAGDDGTVQATQQVQAFFGNCAPSDFVTTTDAVSYLGAAEHSLRRMVLHYAHLVQLAGGVDGFIIGSEMRGLTTIRGAGNTYPSVQALQTLAADVRSVVGAGTRLTYAADWSEYFGHHPDDGAGDVRFHLDPLWADPNIDAVGIDAYFPLADWRDGDAHLDTSVATDTYDTDYLRANMEGGEGYDWYYASHADRDAQTRTPITDGLASKPWVFRNKDIRNWWGQAHYERVNGVELPSPTNWVPKSKPIWFTEIGCPAIDKGANQPNVFWDPKSSESYAPYYSSGVRDDLIQRRYLEAFIGYWSLSEMNPSSDVYAGKMIDVENTHVWCWDSRPFPDFPARENIWSDGENWQTGHWLNGRTGLVSLADIVSEITMACGSPTPDVNRVSGMVSGYVLDRPMSARGALIPLSLVYGFDLIEQADGLSFATKGVQNPIEIDLDMCVQEQGEVLLILNREDAGEQPKDVRFGFIEQGRDYQLAMVTAQNLLAETERVIDVQAPLVLDPAQATVIARDLLAQALEENGSIEFVLPPNVLAVEVGGVVQISGISGQWQITDMDGLGAKRVRAQRIADVRTPLNNGAQPGTLLEPLWGSRPDGFALDIPDFTHDGTRQGPLVGVTINPWAETNIQALNRDTVKMAEPVYIGYLVTGFASGPIGRRDKGATLDIYLPNSALASLDDEVFLSGGNMLAVETGIGWEIFQCQNVELLAPNTYRLSEFLRGLFGSDSVMETLLQSGARIVSLENGWADYPLASNVRGEEINFEVSSIGRTTNETFELPYEAEHLRPLSPVHVHASMDAENANISWIRRTRVDGDDWVSVEVSLGEDAEKYEVDFLNGVNVVATKSTDFPHLQIPISELEALYGGLPSSIDISIAQMSRTYGRGAMQAYTFTL